MQVRDIPVEEARVGLRMRGLRSGREGTVISVNEVDDYWSVVLWDDGDSSGFYWGGCGCEVICGANGNPVYVEVADPICIPASSVRR